MKFQNIEILRKVIWKMHKGYSPVILCVGNPGSGKTMLSAKIAEVIHPIFNNKEQWPFKKYTVFDMNQFSYKFLDAKKKVFVIAEAGFDLTFDEWFNKTNRFFDKVITTQRVMGNCYILNIPIGKDLARRHRRKVNYVLKVTGHGTFEAILNRVRSEAMTGDEFGPLWLEKYYGVSLPKCHEPLKKMDEENKENIRHKIVEEYQEDTKKKEAITTLKRPVYKTITCAKCGHANIPRTAHPRHCPNCGHRYIYPNEEQPKKGRPPKNNKNLEELKL